MGTQGSLRKKREGTGGAELWWSRFGPIQLVRWTAEGGYPHNCTQDKNSGLRARQIQDVRIWRVGHQPLPGAPVESLLLRRLLTFPDVGPSNAAVQGIPSMKSLGLLPLLVLTMTIRLFAAPPMSNADREHLLVHFEMTTQMVAEQVRGLSPAQLEYKASPDRWSIREVVSHLAVAEPDYWREIQKAVKAAPDMKDKKSQATDADIMWYGIDRVVHTKTGGGHEKVDTYKDMGEALGRFQALRATMIGYIKSTDDDLRAHSFGDYGEVIDCWQWMLEISTHAERHIQQIREIKNDPNFPKK